MTTGICLTTATAPPSPISSGSAGKGANLRARLVGNTEPMLSGFQFFLKLAMIFNAH